MQSSKAEKWKIKPLIHLLDSAQEHKINLIQSACITLCNMASKPQLHQHFIHEPEISTIRNCLAKPIDKKKGNELVRFMIKLVCNLTKNSEMLGPLSKGKTNPSTRWWIFLGHFQVMLHPVGDMG